MPIVLLLILLSSVLKAVSIHQPCYWYIRLVPDSSPIYNITHSYTSVCLSQLVHQWNVRNLDAAPKECFESYRKYLEIKLKCDNMDSNRENIELALTSESPLLTLCKWPTTESDGGQLCKTMSALLMDKQSLAGLEWGSMINQPVWMLPVAFNKTDQIILITMDVAGSTQISKTRRFSIMLSQYEDILLASGAKLSLPGALPGNLLLQSLPDRSSLLVLGPVDNVNSVAISKTQFQDFSIYPFPGNVNEDIVCDCFGPQNSVIVYSVASLLDSLLYLTNAGLLEVKRNDSSMDNIHTQLVLKKCIRQMSLPSQIHSYYDQLVLLGACGEEGKIFTSGIHTQYGVHEILDGEGERLCGMFPASKSCTVLSAVSSGNDNGIFLFLTQLISQNNTKDYALIQFTGEVGSGRWLVLCHIPESVPEQLYGSSLPLSLFSMYPDHHILKLSGISLTLKISNHIYIWGNRIIHSPDQGRNLFLLSWLPEGNTSIVQFITSRSGYIVFLTGTQQLWAGIVGSTTFQKIYPSIAWDALEDITDIPCLPDGATIRTMFFDHQEALQVIMSSTSGVSQGSLERYTVPVGRILSYQSMSQSWLTFADITLWNSTANATLTTFIPRSCSLSAIFFEVHSLEKVIQKQHMIYRGPTLSGEPALHSELSLYIYEALLQSIEAQFIDIKQAYIHSYTSPYTRWKNHITPLQSYNQYVYQSQWLKEGISVDLADNKVLNMAELIRLQRLPDVIYMEKNDTWTFSVVLAFKSDLEDLDVTVNSGRLVDQILASITIANSTLVSLHVHRQELLLFNRVIYQVSLQERGNIQQQNPAGFYLLATSLQVVAWATHSHCFDESTDYSPQGSYSMTVQIGCPPYWKIYFDWEATRDRLSDPDVALVAFDCLDPEPNLYCFYYDNRFFPMFRVVDESSTHSWKFQGKYTLKVIGGSTEDQHSIRMFTPEEIVMYNTHEQGISFVVWGPLAENLPTKDGFTVYTHKENGISWICNANSPCANIQPKIPNSPEYYFLVEFSNRGVGVEDTYCEFTFRFVIHVHGLPIGLIKVSNTLVMISILAVSIWAILFYIYHYKKGTPLRIHQQKFTSEMNHVKVHPEPDTEDQSDEEEEDTGDFNEEYDFKSALTEWKKHMMPNLTGVSEVLEEEEEDSDTNAEMSQQSSAILSLESLSNVAVINDKSTRTTTHPNS